MVKRRQGEEEKKMRELEGERDKKKLFKRDSERESEREKTQRKDKDKEKNILI